VQVLLQRLLATGQLGRVHFAVVAQVVLARGRVAAPFAVVGHHLGGAVAVPGGLVGFSGGGRLRLRGGAGAFCWRQRGHRLGHEFGFAVVVTHWRVRLRQAKFLARGFVGVEFQERVVVQHLLDFLAQLQRGQLQQADGLLQLRRQRQMLRNA
jgi:hypothetical protein